MVRRFQGPVGIHLEILEKNIGLGTSFNFKPSYVMYGSGIANDEEFWFSYIGCNLALSPNDPSGYYDTFPKEIFCFNWNGKPLRRIRPDHPFTGFDVDWGNKILIS